MMIIKLIALCSIFLSQTTLCGLSFQSAENYSSQHEQEIITIEYEEICSNNLTSTSCATCYQRAILKLFADQTIQTPQQPWLDLCTDWLNATIQECTITPTGAIPSSPLCTTADPDEHIFQATGSSDSIQNTQSFDTQSLLGDPR